MIKNKRIMTRQDLISKEQCVHREMLSRMTQYTQMASRGMRLGMTFENPTFVSLCIKPSYWRDLILPNTEHGTSQDHYAFAASKAAELLAISWYSLQTIWYTDNMGEIIGNGMAVLGGSPVQRETIIMLSGQNQFFVLKNKQGIPPFAGELLNDLQEQTELLNSVCKATFMVRNNNVRQTNHLLTSI